MKIVIGRLVLGLALAAIALSSAPEARARPLQGGFPPELALEDLVLVHWDSRDGLPSSTLLHVRRTRDGFLWIGSFNGLIRFDGLEFEVFDRRRLLQEGARPFELPANGFHEISVDGDTLWIGSQGSGVLRREHGVVEKIGELNGTVRRILHREDGTLWTGFIDLGLQHWDGREWHDFSFLKTSSNLSATGSTAVTVRDLAWVLGSEKTRLWATTEGQGLFQIGAESFRTGGGVRQWTSDDGLPSNSLTSLHEDERGLWIGSQDGLFFYDGETFRTVLDEPQVSRLYGDEEGNLWIAAQQGLWRLRADGGVETLREIGGVPLRGITALSFDYEGSLWLSTYRDGLYQLRRTPIRNYSVGDGLSTLHVNTLLQDEDGGILVGSEDGHVDRIELDAHGRAEVRTLTIDPPLPGERVRHLFFDREETLWISSYAGLYRHRQDEPGRLFTVESGLPTNQIRSVGQDESGALYVATRDAGLLRMTEEESFEVFLDQSTGLSSDLIFSIEDDPDGRRYFGTYSGLDVRLPDGTLEHYGVEQGVPGNLVFNTTRMDDGSLWLSTNAGVARIIDGEVRSFGSDQGLPVDAIFDLIAADRDLWMSSAVGILRVRLADAVAVLEGRAERLRVLTLTEEDGMGSRECSGTTQILQADDGALWFPTLGGAARLDPTQMELLPPSPVVLREMTVDEETVSLSSVDEIIRLDPHPKNVQISFSAITFLAVEDLQVRYRLIGFEEEWTTLDHRTRRVNYTNLDPGDYVFEATTINRDGLRSPGDVRLRFQIRPAFYQTWWFPLPLLAALAAALRGRSRRRDKVVQEQIRRIGERVDQERRERLDERRLSQELETRSRQLENFAYAVSHDLKNSLSSLRIHVDSVRKDLESGRYDRAQRDLRQMEGALEQTDQTLGGLLDLSRLGRATKLEEEVALSRVARDAIDNLREALEQANVAVDAAHGLPVLLGDHERLTELFEILLANAIRFRDPAKDALRIEIGRRSDERGEIVFVRDNGIGVDEADREKIFELFHRLDPQSEGTGVGLAVARRIAETHGGELWVESPGTGLGSTFCFLINPAS